MILDTHTTFGARVEQRLREEQIIWLTTIGSDGTPQPSPVWFLWDGASMLIYSQPDTPKLHNIGRNPKVALNFDSDRVGGDIVVFSAEAALRDDVPAADEVARYVDKYREGMARIGLPPESFARTYSVALRITPTKVRGH